MDESSAAPASLSLWERVGVRGVVLALALLPGTGLAGKLDYTFASVDIVSVGGGTLQVSTENGALSSDSGYVPLRVFLTNSARAAQTVHLSFDSNMPGAAPITRTVEVDGGERRFVHLYIPAELTYGALSARAPGITEGGRQSVHFSKVTNPQQAVLSLGTAEEFETLVEEGPVYSDHKVMVQTVPAPDAPPELAGYVGYDAVVLPATSLDELPESVRRALEAYAATGGTLVLGRPSRAVRTHLPLLGDWAAGGVTYGFGFVELCQGEGSCLRSPPPSRSVQVSPRGPPPAWLRPRSPIPQDALLPQATAPVGRFLAIIILFTLAIGPGSLVLARRKGPPVLLLTIPLTAVVTSLAIVGYALFKEGFAVHASTRGVTLLDTKNRRAITLGVAAFYANLSPGEARFSSTTALLAPDSRESEVRFAAVDWTQGARFGADFVPSRTYREWGILSVEPSRARLLVQADGGEAPLVKNALGSRIRRAKFRWNDELWGVEDLAEGAEGRAVPRGTQEASFWELAGVHHRLTPSGVVLEEGLKEGEFLAHVDGPSLLPLGGVRIQPHDAEHLIRGEVE